MAEEAKRIARYFSSLKARANEASSNIGQINFSNPNNPDLYNWNSTLGRLSVLSSQIQTLSEELLDQTSSDLNSERSAAENTVFQPTIDHFDPFAPGFSLRSKPITEIEKDHQEYVKQYRSDPKLSTLSALQIEALIKKLQ